MATGGKVSGGNLSKGSEEIFDFYCSPCFKDSNITEAINQCLDCDEYFCGKCINFHNKLGATSGHKVLDRKQMGTVKGSKPNLPLLSQRCKDHGKNITAYCVKHDVFCCGTCASTSHRNCDEIPDILKAAKGVKSSKQLKTTKSNVTTTLKEMKKGKSSRQNDMAALNKDKTTNVKQVKDFTEALIKRIKELEEITIDKISSKHKELNDKASGDVTSLDDMISMMEEDLQKLDQSKKNHEAQVFVDIKLGQSHESEGRKLLQLVSTPRKVGLKFVLKTNTGHFLNDLTSFGSFADNSRILKAKLKGDYNIKVKDDTSTCNTHGFCVLPDGTAILTDWNNRRIKRLDASYKVTDHCDMPRGPWDVTCTAPGEAAVTLTFLKKVQFLSVGGSMSLTRSFSTRDNCRCICYCNGELFVSCGGLTTKGLEEGPGHVAAYSLNGTHIRTIQTDLSGKQIFRCPYHITASSDGTRSYVAQDEGGVVSLDRNGTLLSSFTDPSVTHEIGLCTLDNGHVLVCGHDSHNVLQFDSDGRKLTELLRYTDGIKHPCSLCYDSATFRLIVTLRDADCIKVFELA